MSQWAFVADWNSLFDFDYWAGARGNSRSTGWGVSSVSGSVLFSVVSWPSPFPSVDLCVLHVSNASKNTCTSCLMEF